MTPKATLQVLATASARWGADDDLVQGQGGNISFKEAGVLYVKGSGTRLEDALAEEIFVACDLSRCLKAYAAGDEAGVKASKVGGPDHLKPSIETSLHAVLSDRFVFHYHCVNAIAATASGAIKGARKKALEDFGALLVGYRQPGLKLAAAIAAEGVTAPAYIMQNHGVIVQGDTLDHIQERLDAVSSIVSIPPAFPIIDPPRRMIAEDGGWSRYADADMRALGKLVAAHPALREETLYPDHAVILGHGVPVNADEGRGWFIDAQGHVHVRDAARPALEPMLEAFVRIVSRLDLASPRAGLSAGDVGVLLNWEAEKERQALAKARMAGDQ